MSVCVAQSSLSAFSHMYLSLSSVFQSDCRSLKYCVCCVQNVSRWVCLRSSSRRHPSHYVNYVLNEQYQYESVPNHKWMYGKIFNFHFAMRVALGVRMMSSLWNSIDSFQSFPAPLSLSVKTSVSLPYFTNITCRLLQTCRLKFSLNPM